MIETGAPPATRLLCSLVFLALLAGCSGDESATNDRSNRTEASTAIDPVSMLATSGPRRGTVLTAVNTGGYTYLEVDVEGRAIWLATMMTAVTPGAEVRWKEGAVMTHFRSKALNRTFARILFVDRLEIRTAEVAHNRRGIVSEFLNAAGYSYIRVDEGGTLRWLAVPQLALEVGQVIEWRGGSLMRNFSSPSLNQVFDEILFLSRVSPA